MTKEEILEYVMDTPENTNRAVLNDMLNELQTSGKSGLVVETEWEDATYPLNPRFKSTVLGTDFRAAIMNGQNVIVHIPGKFDYSIPEGYFTPILRVTDASGQEDNEYVLPTFEFGSLMNGKDDNEGYVEFKVYAD